MPSSAGRRTSVLFKGSLRWSMRSSPHRSATLWLTVVSSVAAALSTDRGSTSAWIGRSRATDSTAGSARSCCVSAADRAAGTSTISPWATCVSTASMRASAVPAISRCPKARTVAAVRAVGVSSAVGTASVRAWRIRSDPATAASLSSTRWRTVSPSVSDVGVAGGSSGAEPPQALSSSADTRLHSRPGTGRMAGRRRIGRGDVRVEVIKELPGNRAGPRPAGWMCPGVRQAGVSRLPARRRWCAQRGASPPGRWIVIARAWSRSRR